MKTHQTNKKTKTSKTDQSLSYLDTSVLRKIRFGHPRQKEALASIPTPHYVSTYVLMEFYRSVLLYFIDPYFEAAERRHPTFLDACNFYAEAFSSNDLKTLVGVILLLLQEQDFAPADPDKKEICRRKLQDHILALREIEWVILGHFRAPGACK